MESEYRNPPIGVNKEDEWLIRACEQRTRHLLLNLLNTAVYKIDELDLAIMSMPVRGENGDN